MRMMKMKTMYIIHNPLYNHDYDHNTSYDYAYGFDLDHLQDVGFSKSDDGLDDTI